MGRRSKSPVEAKRAPGDEEHKLLFCKDNVAVHPSSNERINGQLRLVKQGFSVFMTWMPYDDAKKKQKGKSFDRDRGLYTIRAVSLEEMKSIRCHTPPFGWQYIIVVLTTGLAFPPLYFHNGGVREFLKTLRAYSNLRRASEDPNVYLVNDTKGPPQSPASLEHKSSIQEESTIGTNIYDQIERRPRNTDPLEFLETFSMVTKFARDTTGQLINGLEKLNLEKNKASARRKGVSQAPAGALEDNILGKGEASTSVGNFELVDDIQDELPDSESGEARIPLEEAEWITFLDAEGRVTDPSELRKRVFYGGIRPFLRPVVWKFLLDFHPFSSTYEEREAITSSKTQEYRILKSQWQTVTAEQPKRFSDLEERRSRIEKDVVRTDRTTEFYCGEDDNPNVILLRDILITYSFYNFELGYCQGMSDLLSPILYVMKSEEEAFWCFASLMEQLGPNFHRDQNGMHSQLRAVSELVRVLDPPLHNYFAQVECLNYFFCFRWILIQFKREFAFEDVLRLWEVLWSRHLSEHFHLYICVALLKRHRRKIMDERMEFDTLIKFINELSGRINLERTLRDAEVLCRFGLAHHPA